MNSKICPKCDAKWMEGNHYWSTGAKGNEADLAGLVCDQWGDDNCINPLRGTDHDGDTWESRFEKIKSLTDRPEFNEH